MELGGVKWFSYKNILYIVVIFLMIWRTCTVFHNSCTILHSHQQYEFPHKHLSFILLIILLFYFTPSQTFIFFIILFYFFIIAAIQVWGDMSFWFWFSVPSQYLPKRIEARFCRDSSTPVFVVALIIKPRCGSNLNVHGHVNGWRKCGMYIYWTIIQSLKRRKLYIMQQYGWNLTLYQVK